MTKLKSVPAACSAPHRAALERVRANLKARFLACVWCSPAVRSRRCSKTAPSCGPASSRSLEHASRRDEPVRVESGTANSYHPQPLRSGLMRSRFPESSISVASRRCRVSSRFALVTQRAACLR